jgi:hypothetical protein
MHPSKDKDNLSTELEDHHLVHRNNGYNNGIVLITKYIHACMLTSISSTKEHRKVR